MNPLQPKILKYLNSRSNTVAINLTSASKSGFGDVVACIEGDFYMFEVKYDKDTPTELQKDKINRVIKAGGKAYFIRSLLEIKIILDNDYSPIMYRLTNEKFIL